MPILNGCKSASRQLVLLWSQLGDFDSLEYAWWLQREGERLQTEGVVTRAVGVGDLASGQRFCAYTGLPADWLFVDPAAELHQRLNLYQGLSFKVPYGQSLIVSHTLSLSQQKSVTPWTPEL